MEKGTGSERSEVPVPFSSSRTQESPNGGFVVIADWAGWW